MRIPENIQKLQDLIMTQTPEKADAIIWLQGDQLDRAKKVVELFESGFALRILITGNNILLGPIERIEESNYSLDEMKTYLIGHNIDSKAISIDDKSMNTREQAEKVIQYLKDNNLNSMILVGSPYYQLRAFLTFLKCAQESEWDGHIINQPADLPWDKPPAGRKRTAKEYFTEVELPKIKKYQKHVAKIEDGIAYQEFWKEKTGEFRPQPR